MLKRLTVALSALMVLCSALPQPARADQELKSLKKPIPIELSSSLSSADAAIGDAFEGVLAETLIYRKGESKQQIIPQGTVFKGHVKEVKKSKRYARAGFVELELDEAVLPSGDTYRFDMEKFEHRNKRYYHKKGVTVKRLITNSLPMAGSGLGTSIPLHYAVGMAGGLIVPISLGARTVTAFTLESIKRDGRTLPQLMGYSLARGSGALATYNFFRVSQNLQLKEGNVVKLYLDPEFVGGLLQANDDIEMLNSTTR